MGTMSSPARPGARPPPGDPGPAGARPGIVAYQAEPAEAELVHQPDLVPRHEPPGVRAAFLVRLGFAGPGQCA